MKNEGLDQQESLVMDLQGADDSSPIEDEELNLRRIFRFGVIEGKSFKAENVLVVIKSNDEVIFQSNIKSKNKQTRGDRNHLRAKVEGFDRDGLRLFEWKTGTLGIYCRQDEIRQHSGSFPNTYKNIQQIGITLECYYRGC